MSDYIPSWVALGTGVAEGEKQRQARKKEREEHAAEGDADVAEPADNEENADS